MATITPSVASGAYMEHQTVSFSFSADVTEVALTTGNIPPSVSKYIAYDTLTPPNPFLAVTEDGRGRVVYDGGFPKFLNSYWNNATTFAGLDPAAKFLYNAINWVHNTVKWNAGNKKILLLSDGFNSHTHYSARDTGPNGLQAVFNGVASILGATLTVKNSNDWGGEDNGKVDIRLTELEQYALVIYLGNWSAGESNRQASITPQSINDIVTYRENGNGLIFITDHGPTYNSIEEAIIGDKTLLGWWPGFFATCNKIVTRFGAYFTGNYDRSPVNVGFLRANYGDHPLYNGLANTDNIYAGGSESMVVTQQTQTYAPGALPAVTTTLEGMNTINVLAISNTGEITTARYVYIVQGDEFVFVVVNNPKTGESEENPAILQVDDSGRPSISLAVDGTSLGTIWGEIMANGKRIGEFGFKGGLAYSTIYASKWSRTRFKDGDIVEHIVRSPFEYAKTMTVARATPKTTALGVTGWAKQLRDNWVAGAVSMVQKRAYDASKALNNLLPANTSLASPRLRKALIDIVLQKTDAGEFTANIFATTAETTAAAAAGTVGNDKCYIDASTGNVYAYLTGTHKLIGGLKPKDIYPVPCQLRNGTNVWKLDANGVLTKV